MKKLFWLLIVTILITSLLPSATTFAQGDFVELKQVDDNTLSFDQLKEQEKRLFGPFATETILFGLPANWKLLNGAQFELDYSVSIESASTTNQLYSGTLTVFLNKQIIAALPVSQPGTFTQLITVPLQSLTSDRIDGRQELVFVLSSTESCLYDQAIDVVVHSSSQFTFPHDIATPNTNFSQFPRPLYQDTIFTDSALIVIPDDPSAGELQAALTVSAGLQARTDEAMLIDVVNYRGLNEGMLAQNHLIIIGNSSSLPILYQLVTPLQLQDGLYAEAGEAGVLQMIPSPWSPDRVVLVVSGNNDQATIKAAQALSTGTIRPTRFENLALIDSVNNRVYTEQPSVNQSLEGLGYDNITFEGRSETTETFQFYIPVGQTITPESYFEVSLSNSTLLNYVRSGMFVALNDRPIGSIRFSDDTANKANNRIQIAIPPSAVRSGTNLLDVIVVLEPLDDCSDPDQAGLFVTLWSDSRLYMPLSPAPVEAVEVPDLSNYPFPFIQSPDLAKTAFILQRGNLDAWASAIQIAGNLGAIADGAIFTPSVFYADETDNIDLTPFNMIAVGIPSAMEFMGQLNENLPAPFSPESDAASEEELQVVYRIDPTQPTGYLELLPSPWNLENLIVTAVGNSPEGIGWAANALLQENDRQSLLGNFAVIRAEQIISVDTRLLELEDTSIQPPTTTTPVSSEIAMTTNVQNSSPNWVPIALGLSVALILIVILIAIYFSRKKA